jgi:hypothetical protein
VRVSVSLILVVVTRGGSHAVLVFSMVASRRQEDRR